MKKVLSVLAILVCISLIFVGCGETSQPTPDVPVVKKDFEISINYAHYYEKTKTQVTFFIQRKIPTKQMNLRISVNDSSKNQISRFDITIPQSEKEKEFFTVILDEQWSTYNNLSIVWSRLEDAVNN